MDVTHYDILGFIGAVVIVIAFLGNIRGTLHSEGAVYPALNLIGAGLILYSLFWAWNVAAALVEAFWVAISVYGLVKYFRGRRGGA